MLDPEEDDGNIEYKWKLLDESDERIERIASQMRYRCNEGNSECIYNLGVEDDGKMTGLNKEEYEVTMKCLEKATSMNSCKLTVLTETLIEDERYVYEIHIREHNEDKYIDIKVAIAGNVDCGKSTLLSVLTSGLRDNGRGSSRLSVFNFSHEIESGRTSSIGQQIVGYDECGRVMNYTDKRQIAWPDIVKRSAKIATFFDLAGHEKYLKTTILGLTSSHPDICLIMVAANKGLSNKMKMTLEHMFLCKTLHIPFCVVVTKIDMVKDKQNVMDETLASITTVLKKPGMRRFPVRIKTCGDMIRCAVNIHSESIVPIFLVSNVTMEGIENLHYFLNLLPRRCKAVAQSEVEHRIDASWTITGVGTVVGGHLMSGTVKVGDKLWCGPLQNKYIQVTVRSLHCKRVQVQHVSKQTYICLALKGIHKQDVHRGLVLLSEKSQHILCNRLIVDIEVLKTHSTTIKIGYQPIMHAQHVRICVTIQDIVNKKCGRDGTQDDKILRTGDTAKVHLLVCFDKRIFVKPGTDILLCEGRTKVIGHVCEIFEDKQFLPC